MRSKIFVLLAVFYCYTTFSFALRKTPKIYNALITTDENLTSSRAYPVIQPTFQESGILHHPYYPYFLPSSYVGGVGGIGSVAYPRVDLQNRFIGTPISHQQFIPGNQPGLLANTPDVLQKQTPQVAAVTTQAETTQTTTGETAIETEIKQQKLPSNPNEQLIPHLPPALIPIQRYPPPHYPYLSNNPRQPYSNSFYAQRPPYLFNPHGQYLPNFYNNDPRHNLVLQPGNEQNKPNVVKETPTIKVTNAPTDEKLDNKKEDANVKENVVPDVPPPPVPSGGSAE